MKSISFLSCRTSVLATLSTFAALAIGCGATEGTSNPGIEDSGASDVAIDAVESGVDATADVVLRDGEVPPARRLACVDRSGLATDLPADAYGALEAELVSIVLPGTKGCPSDTDHLHLQLDVGGKRYDVAITIDSTTGGTPIALITKDIATTSAPAGWSDVGFDFAKDLAIPSADFKAMTRGELLTKLQAELATVSLVSIHGRSYTDGTGLHNVHRNGAGHDGVILVRRVGASGTDHAIALRFSGDVF